MNKEQFNESLVSRRIFPVTGKIENVLISDMEKALFQMFLNDPSKTAHLLIDSGGGDVRAALSAYDFIKSLPFSVHCTIVGDCHSSALTLISACKKRSATKHSRFFFHAMTVNSSLNSLEDYESQVLQLLENHKIMFNQTLEIQSIAFNLKKKELIKMRKDGQRYDVRLTTEEALRKGIIHEIVEKFEFFKLPGE